MGYALIATSVLAVAGLTATVIYRRRYRQAVQIAAFHIMQREEEAEINFNLHMNIARHNARQTNLELGVVLPPEEENNN